jgi:hypothetical protein
MTYHLGHRTLHTLEPVCKRVAANRVRHTPLTPPVLSWLALFGVAK